MRLRPTLAVVVGLAGLALPVTSAAPAYADDNTCDTVDVNTPRDPAGVASQPFELLGMAAAQAEVVRSAPNRKPVRVAVLSSGVYSGDGAMKVHAAVNLSGVADNELSDPQGTVVAGVIAGVPRADGQQVGFAPETEVVDVRVFVDRGSNERVERPATPTLAAGLRWVAQQARARAIKIAVVPFVVRGSNELKAAVAAVQKAGVVVVAAVGDRPEEGTEFSNEIGPSPEPDEDAAELFFPAGYPGVVAVNVAAVGLPDGGGGLVRNSRTTVAAPAYHAVSYGLNGATCVVEPASTAVAAGEVGGVLALLWQRFPRERAAQVVARLVNTADGTPDGLTPLTGAGVVQPDEALTRPLAPAADGTVERTVQLESAGRAVTAEPGADLLASTRDRAVWWGLIGGGLLVIALLLRPVLARRRT